jgi:hypothetical protein
MKKNSNKFHNFRSMAYKSHFLHKSLCYNYKNWFYFVPSLHIFRRFRIKNKSNSFRDRSYITYFINQENKTLHKDIGEFHLLVLKYFNYTLDKFNY